MRLVINFFSDCIELNLHLFLLYLSTFVNLPWRLTCFRVLTPALVLVRLFTLLVSILFSLYCLMFKLLKNASQTSSGAAYSCYEREVSSITLGTTNLIVKLGVFISFVYRYKIICRTFVCWLPRRHFFWPLRRWNEPNVSSLRCSSLIVLTLFFLYSMDCNEKCVLVFVPVNWNNYYYR